MGEENQTESNSDAIENQNTSLELDLKEEPEEIHQVPFHPKNENHVFIQADGDSKQFTQAENENEEIILEKKKKRNVRKHKKRKKIRGSTIPVNQPTELEENLADEPEIEYIQESVSLIDLAPQHRQFFQIFEAFKIPESNPILPPPQLVIPVNLSDTNTKTSETEDRADSDEEKPKENKPILSNRKLKKVSRISMADLKLSVNKPNVVEMHDVNSKDPKLLVALKAYPNTVPVPRHWCYKRKYLQGKRGFEKPPFKLPEFIRNTGISEMRAVYQEKEESKSLKSKMREQIRPKMGKIDIDYKKLHDAFFKYQTKPKLTLHGDLYYEGKELETRLSGKKPGNLSEELFDALGMPVSNKNIPPPWLIAMQRYGPPPSYSNLKIPGLNAPIPSGCMYGYHAGGWGKPPVDESGRPLYGDVFGENTLHDDDFEDDYENNRVHWGEYGSEDESEEEVESEKENNDETVEVENQDGLVTPAEELETPSDIVNNFSGLETPDSIELRKRKIEKEMESNETLKLFEVLPEKPVSGISGMMMGSTHVYDMTGAGIAPPALLARNSQLQPEPRKNSVVLTLDPEELEMDSELIEKRYQQHQDSVNQKDNFSDMVLEHVNKQSKNKRKRQDDYGTKKVKKYKDFKF